MFNPLLDVEIDAETVLITQRYQNLAKPQNKRQPQTVTTAVLGVESWYRKAHHLALRKAYPSLFHTENKQLAKISSLTANDLETSEVPYFTSFCIKSKEHLW